MFSHHREAFVCYSEYVALRARLGVDGGDGVKEEETEVSYV